VKTILKDEETKVDGKRKKEKKTKWHSEKEPRTKSSSRRQKDRVNSRI
jgi:hypothetical protein